MRKSMVLAAVLAAFVVLAAPAAWAGGVNFVNQAGTNLKFFTQGVTRDGRATEWKLWHLGAHHHIRVTCHGCVSFNFEIRTDQRHPARYQLDLDRTYKLNYNRQKHKWDLFQ